MKQEKKDLYNEYLEWLFSRQRFLNPTLERTRALLNFLENPQDNFDAVLVGGTNGKGSVVVSLAAMLQASGKRTARFISPHLSYFSERFVVDGQPVSDEAILDILIPLKEEAERVEASFFEIVTAMACKLFADANVDVAVLEVGMGGRFDSTNCLEPVTSIITNVSLDHTKILGDSVEKIAKEKAQIMRAGNPCFSAATGTALATLKTEAKTIGANFIVLEDIARKNKNLGWEGIEIDFSDENLLVQSSLIGEHQLDNVSLAVLAAKHLITLDKRASHEAIQQGAKAAHWPGRLETVRYKGQRFLLDGAHNQASAKALARAILNLSLNKPVLVFGISADKDLNNVVSELADSVGEVILCKASNSPRAAEPTELVKTWSNYKAHETIKLADSLQDALDKAIKLTSKQNKDQNIVIAGSLYLIGEVRPLLLQEETESWERWQ